MVSLNGETVQYTHVIFTCKNMCLMYIYHFHCMLCTYVKFFECIYNT